MTSPVNAFAVSGVISVVRSVAGEDWCPREMCFVSSSHLPDAVRTAFPDTRILLSQPHTSVAVELEHLALPTRDATEATDIEAVSSAPEDTQPEFWEFVGFLRMMVQPYLCEGRTDVAFAAAMAGVSTRTLKRRLRMCGTSYSRLLKEARFGLARTLLEDPAVKVIDVSVMAG
jgi:AraC-like DNA-binding protein